MSGVFGWSLPPGCGTLPGEEYGASDLTAVVEALMGGLAPSLGGVFWTEDSDLIEVRAVEVPVHLVEDMDGNLVAEGPYSDTYEANVGEHEWDDDMGDAMNFVAAATRYVALTT